MPYEPRPINTSNVELPPSLEPLLERLAEHNHDIWAQHRINAGWSWGPERNDEQKHHPCLVPYSELPDSEKQLDRATTCEVLKAILALGYRIED